MSIPERLTPLPQIVLDRKEYEALWWQLYVEQEGKCYACSRQLPLTLHHEEGRGLAGGFRRDVPETSRLLCLPCHQEWDKDRKPRKMINATQR